MSRKRVKYNLVTKQQQNGVKENMQVEELRASSQSSTTRGGGVEMAAQHTVSGGTEENFHMKRK